MNNIMDKENTTADLPEAKPAKKPKTGLIRFAAAVACILLLFGIGFIGVSVIVSDTDFIEDQYAALGTDQEMGMTIPDLSKATMALFNYMRGNRDDIKVSVVMNGVEVDDLFYHTKEVIHMKEVRALWRGLTAFVIIGIAAALGLLAAIVFFGRHNTRLRATGAGFLIGTLLFAGVMATAAIWAISDFNSFWTVFHFIIFPDSLITYLSGGMTVETYNSLNWVFEPSFAMIRMLDELFLPLVLRASIVFGMEIVVFLLLSLLMYNRGRKLSQAGSDIVEVREVVEQDRYVPVDDAPDLVLQHKLQNASLKQKMKMMEELRRDPNEPVPDTDKPEETEKAEEAADPANEETIDNAASEADANNEILELPKDTESATLSDIEIDTKTESEWERPKEETEEDGEPENDLF